MIDISYALRQVGVLSSDWVMLHGDAGVAAQLKTIDPGMRILQMQQQLIQYMAPGTLLVPTFSYSFTKGENFDPNNTPSNVGKFSEFFRLLPGIKRTRHPIFSVATVGVGTREVMDARLDDCFGPETVFDLLIQRNGKIVCLGCDFNRVTFVHYVEQKCAVRYRYNKKFAGMLIDGGRQTPLELDYLVRDINIKTTADLSWLKSVAIKRGKLRVAQFGRFPIMSISAQDFLELAIELLRQDEYALIEQGASKYAI